MPKSRFIIILCILFAAICLPPVSSAQEVTTTAAFNKEKVDLGKFSEKDAVRKAEITVTNTGDSPLIIVKVHATCGCTTVSYPRAPIKPGKTAVISIEYDGRGRFKGPFNKLVNIYTNTPKKVTRIMISGDMTD